VRQELISREDEVRSKQLEIDNLKRAELEFTVTAAAQTQAAEMSYMTATAQSINATQQAAALTATAYPTAAELQRQAVALVNSQLTAEAEAPQLLREKVAAEAYQSTWQYYEALKMFLEFVLGLLVIILIIRLIVGTLYKWVQLEKLNEQAAEVMAKNDLLPIPKIDRNIIQCSNEQLVFFAEGVVNDGKSLVFADWTNTPVSPVIKGIRDFFAQTQADGKVFAIETSQFILYSPFLVSITIDQFEWAAYLGSLLRVHSSRFVFPLSRIRSDMEYSLATFAVSLCVRSAFFAVRLPRSVLRWFPLAMEEATYQR